MNNKQYIVKHFLDGNSTKEIMIPSMRHSVEELCQHMRKIQLRNNIEQQQYDILEKWLYAPDAIYDFIHIDNVTNLIHYKNIITQIVYPLYGLLPKAVNCSYSVFIHAVYRALDTVHTPKPFKKLLRALDIAIENNNLLLSNNSDCVELLKEPISIWFNLLTELRAFASVYKNGAKIIISANPEDMRQASVTTTGWSSCFAPEGSRYILIEDMVNMPNLAMAVLTTAHGTIMDKISRCFVLFDDLGGVCTTNPQPTTNDEFEAQVILALTGKIESDINIEFDELSHRFVNNTGEPYYGTNKNCKVSFTTGGKY